MSVSAAQVKDLRERTGAGFMDCKRALAETSGDVDKAIEYLRAKGAAKAEKRGGRAASQGVVIAKVAEQGGYAMLLEINCETDFVARGDEFSQFAQQVSDLAMAQQCTSTEALLALPYPGDTVSVAEKTQALIATIGENIQVRRLAAYVGEGSISTYTHGDRLASWVVLSEDQGGVARDLAMHVAASQPLAINEEGIDPAILDKERRVYDAQAAESNKPEAIREKMVAGKLSKFMKANALINQPFVKDPDQSVQAWLASHGSPQVLSFSRFELGEGIEVVQENLADAVSSMLSGE